MKFSKLKLEYHKKNILRRYLNKKINRYHIRYAIAQFYFEQMEVDYET